MISPDCAGLDKVRLHYDFPAVNCIICKEKKKYFHLFSKSCGWRMLPRDIVPAQICHWFFLILLSSFKSCDVALASSTESLLFLFFNMRCSQRKVTASYSNSFFKKKINQCRKCYATWMLSRGKTKQEKVPFKQNALCSHLTIQHHNRNNAKANSRGTFELLWIHL